ncbi:MULTISPECIES: hypothetical protein [unclassified Rhizobium]|uniref:hypothetical protein n=1 Tax=unclassified Rhizobium TaxID=2613769 RepID=UPI000BD15DFE|nr:MULTISPECIES: hypothetical protein [unclassified Rhizobium]MDH7805717.1 hypothetical protein [Rhizobium sp. AN67]MDQ4407192.1 hypothetical protein [Rhizobium sp. AN63]SOD59795.1 hypothetical protein SAMN05216595_4957 [Rhizobium sp. AN6A]
MSEQATTNRLLRELIDLMSSVDSRLGTLEQFVMEQKAKEREKQRAEVQQLATQLGSKPR